MPSILTSDFIRKEVVCLERRGRYIEFDFDDIYSGPAVVGIVAAVFMVLILLITGLNYAMESQTEESIKAQNEAAAIFNELPAETRAGLISAIEYDTKDDLIVSPDESQAELKEATRIIIEYSGHGILLIGYLVASVWAMIEYWRVKRSKYFFVDLPRGWLGFVTILFTWPCFPVYLVSAIHLMIWSLKLRLNESEEVKHAAETELESERTYMSPKQERSARKRYIEFASHDRIYNRGKLKENLSKTIKQLEEDLKKQGETLRNTQRKLSINRSELATLERETALESKARAEAEWEEIRKMRGVSKVAIVQNNHKITLIVSVRVRVPYEGDLYDFGDYDVKISGSGYQATRTRSGVRADATSKRPNYNESGGFCFGDRAHEIRDYVGSGRMLEALILIIDSLHSVNDEDAEADIPKCFRKVSAIERAKQKIVRKGAKA